ncbi:MAG: Gx transporter family protein [Lachnospiraceae bacterium]|nr:Gx transporter family protein [Lachnospiraceae bacterium]
MQLPIKKMTFYSIMGALAIALSAAEYLIIPEIGLLPPGAKPGLANIVVLVAACTGSIAGTFYIILLKSLFVLITRGGSAFFMSISGGLVSGICMVMLIRNAGKLFSLIGISVISAVVHNMAQFIAASVQTGMLLPVFYLAMLIVFGIISGVLTGVLAETVLPRLIKVLKPLQMAET